jgi:hypothetical protein
MNDWMMELVPIVDNKENMIIVGCCQVQHLMWLLEGITSYETELAEATFGAGAQVSGL